MNLQSTRHCPEPKLPALWCVPQPRGKFSMTSFDFKAQMLGPREPATPRLLPKASSTGRSSIKRRVEPFHRRAPRRRHHGVIRRIGPSSQHQKQYGAHKKFLCPRFAGHPVRLHACQAFNLSRQPCQRLRGREGPFELSLKGRSGHATHVRGDIHRAIRGGLGSKGFRRSLRAARNASLARNATTPA